MVRGEAIVWVSGKGGHVLAISPMRRRYKLDVLTIRLGLAPKLFLTPGSRRRAYQQLKRVRFHNRRFFRSTPQFAERDTEL
jgi:hypothetical protein